jgi:hypothetical protein
LFASSVAVIIRAGKRGKSRERRIEVDLAEKDGGCLCDA